MPALNQFTETPIDWTETSTYRLDSRTGVGKNPAIYEYRPLEVATQAQPRMPKQGSKTERNPFFELPPRYMAYIAGSTFLENNRIEGPEETWPFNLVN